LVHDGGLQHKIPKLLSIFAYLAVC